MKIGELSAATGTPVETIRFYEREGLLPVPRRSSGNYRIYGDDHVARLAFIRHCRSLDMALDEVRVLLRFKDAPQSDCGEVNRVLDEHIGHVAHRIRELKALEKQLKGLRAQCHASQEAGACGILEGLSQAATQTLEAVPPRPAAGHHIGRTHGRH
ncbi:Cd(II)/Pb(II)-responsive transcriptional regulator [Aquabacterium soli]|uniref:Cd(II)/Pb(II)-responsive transcriptional regulator n=1 Tax=Aquabacterium soli TaxID=2493092 RepID=A0A3R8S3W9_9BURK|nr:Cd(II)/Pb(II)-responsive transcriptional regulator [Aquabacterium soli]RRS05496.1 Cd(II)/Pb(II)-responsive transcriptional regulator [Aquabacterium soli]